MTPTASTDRLNCQQHRCHNNFVQTYIEYIISAIYVNSNSSVLICVCNTLKPIASLRLTAYRKRRRPTRAQRFPSAPFLVMSLICSTEVPITNRACPFVGIPKITHKNHSKCNVNTAIGVCERQETTLVYSALFNLKNKVRESHRKRMSIGSVRVFSHKLLAEIVINHILTVSLVCRWPIGWFVFEFSGRV